MLVGLWVTTGCNLNCTYCYEGSSKKNVDMNESTVNMALDFILNHMNKYKDNKLKVQFHGGEPLLNFGLIKYTVESINKRLLDTGIEAEYGITTNGILLSDEIIEFLARHMGIEFSLSIDGNKKTHDLYRKFHNNEGTYETVLTNGLLLLGKAPRLAARLTYNSVTVEWLYDNIVHLLNLGFNKIITNPDYYDNNWNEKSMEILLQEMQKVKDYYDSNGLKDKRISISLIQQSFVNRGKCSGGIHNIHVLPNGDVYPCSYGVGLSELILCNLHETGRENTYITNLKRLNDINTLDNDKCLGCTNYNCCISTRCKILNKKLTCSYYTPSSFICALENVKYRFLS